MADLPSLCLAPQMPRFYYTTLHYFGPFKVKVGRKKMAKHYGVLFTCPNTRADQLEMAVDCTTMELMQVLHRFFSIWGFPPITLSDNGSQMTGVARELRDMVKT